MKPVDQTRLYDPANQSPPGNCFHACVASILECAIGDVPDEAAHWRPGVVPRVSWRKFWCEFVPWLRGRGFGYLECTIGADADVWLDGVPVIASGPSPRDPDIQHAVVGTFAAGSFILLHDPHPSRDGLAGAPTSFSFFIPVST